MIKKTLVINGVTRNLVLDKDETLATVLENACHQRRYPESCPGQGRDPGDRSA